MPTVQTYLDAWADLVRRHTRYEAINGRCNPWFTGFTDCSGGVCACMARAGEKACPSCTGSFDIARIGHRLGLGISIAEAKRTPGALAFQGINEGQGGIPGVDHGHIATFTGTGFTVEARGHWAGVGYFRDDSLVWDWAMKPFSLTAPGATPAPPPQPALAVEDDDDMIPLPSTNNTPPGEVASARVVKSFNFVLLESGARVAGDAPVNGKTDTHWWAPHAGQVPGWQIIGCMTVAPEPGAPKGSLVARYGFPNGDTGTYKTAIQ